MPETTIYTSDTPVFDEAVAATEQAEPTVDEAPAEESIETEAASDDAAEE